jgi:hypothetical protein
MQQPYSIGCSWATTLSSVRAAIDSYTIFCDQGVIQKLTRLYMGRPWFSPSFNLEVILTRYCHLLIITIVRVSVEKHRVLTAQTDSHACATSFLNIWTVPSTVVLRVLFVPKYRFTSCNVCSPFFGTSKEFQQCQSSFNSLTVYRNNVSLVVSEQLHFLEYELH